jgi:hypothetical protein
MWQQRGGRVGNVSNIRIIYFRSLKKYPAQSSVKTKGRTAKRNQ